MDYKLIEKIERLGLQRNEAKVYVATVELGRATVMQISKAASLNRTTGYDILKRLAVHGLVYHEKAGKKKIVVAAPPSSLTKYLRLQKKQAEMRVQEVEDILPELQERYKTEIKPSIKFAEGKEEMEKLYLNVLEAKGLVYSILNLKNFAEFFDDIGTYQSKERRRRGIRERVLCVKNDTSTWWYNKTYKKKDGVTEYRWVPDNDRFNTGGEINIFDDKVIGLLSKPSENIAFEIQSQTVADFLKIIFEMAWDHSQEPEKK